jgi:NAD+ synthase (glutamine-hydrolysing)
MRFLLAQINPTIADLEGNTEKILQSIAKAQQLRADLVLFPELALTGYPPEDFLLLPHFIQSLNNYLEEIKKSSKELIVIVGTPRYGEQGRLYSSAAIFNDGNLIGYQDKTLLPTYDVFAERRYFEPAKELHLWNLCGKRVGITICEDLWQHSNLLPTTPYENDPVLDLAAQKPDLVLNLSASPYSVGKPIKRLAVCSAAAVTMQCPVLLCNQIGGNDGLIFDGYSLHLDKNGSLKNYAKGFVEEDLLVDLSESNKTPSYPPLKLDSEADLYNALVLGIRDYFSKSGFKRACLGLSGGIDSALVACIAAEALGADNILGVAMPSRFSSKGSLNDAKQLAKTLGIQYKEIPIEEPFNSYLELLNPHFEGKQSDCTEENLQARIRGMLLMALSNKFGYIVLSTGNKSELAMGYATLYGDMCGGLGVISDLTKRQVYQLSHWINRDREIIPLNTIKKEPSAELRPDQKDSDSLPPYDIVDNVLQSYVEDHHSPVEIAKKYGYSLEVVNDLIRRIHQNEYKRRQSPPGLRVSEKAFWVGRRFPIVQRWVK